jgi:hypothetical protein
MERAGCTHEIGDCPDGNQVQRAYLRTDFLEQRRPQHRITHRGRKPKSGEAPIARSHLAPLMPFWDTPSAAWMPAWVAFRSKRYSSTKRCCLGIFRSVITERRARLSVIYPVGGDTVER